MVCFDISKKTLDVISAEGGTAVPLNDVDSSSSLLLLKKVMAPYPIPPASANMAIFWSMAEEEEDFLDSLLENDRSCGGRMMLADLATALNDTVENIIVR